MAAVLRGTIPPKQSSRLKSMVYGAAGVGKTYMAIQMPGVYVIDTEQGTTQYGDMIRKSKGSVFSTVDIGEVIEEVKALATNDHDYRTIVIDSFSPLWDQLLSDGAEKVGTEFGRHYGWAQNRCRPLFNLLAMSDLNVIVTCHAKKLYSDDMKAQGQTFDGWRKLDYVFDLVLEVSKIGQRRVAKVVKTRLPEFPDEDIFDWRYEALAEKYGADAKGREQLERKSEPVKLATKAQISKLLKLIDTVKVDDDLLRKWKTKARVDDWDEMPREVIAKCINALEKKVRELDKESDK